MKDLSKKACVTLAHGSGGEASHELIAKVAAYYSSSELQEMGDAALVPINGDQLETSEGELDRVASQPKSMALAESIKPPVQQLALTTDSFVVDPLFFPGGDIGKLAVCGTVNDLLMRGARPAYLTLGMIIEEGLPFSDLEVVAQSVGEAADQAGVRVVAGDTKVIEGQKPGGGLYLNTAGVGFFSAPYQPVPVAGLKAGDAIILSGSLGDHHAVIMSQRLGIKNNLVSDVASLGDMVYSLRQTGIPLHAMRDVTRGGLATVLNELAEAAGVEILLEESQIPLHDTVAGLCDMLGLDPLEMGNEGKLVLAVPDHFKEAALATVRATENGREAAVIGRVEALSATRACVRLSTKIGTERLVMPLIGEGLPRIC